MAAGAILLVPATGLFLLVVSVVWPDDPSVGTGMEAFVDGLFTLAALLPVALGLWLVRRGDPGLFGRIFAGLRAVPAATRAAWSWRTLIEPTPLLLATWAVGLVPVLVAGEPGALLSALGLSALGLAQPLAALRARSWRRAILLSLVSWSLLVMVLGALPQVEALREGAMIYLLPFMSYPTGLALSALLRGISWLRGRRRGPDAPG